MMLKRFLLLLLCCWLFQNAGFTQSAVNFTAITTRSGLSSNTVNAILQDHYGLMWFATEDGLNKFDGTNFKVYRRLPGDSTSLSANEILSLHEDRAGNLWIGTGGGSLCLYDRRQDAFIRFAAGSQPGQLRNNVIRSIGSDNKGNLWVGHYQGVDIIDASTRKITPFQPASGQPYQKVTISLYQDSQHNMWLASDDGLYLFNKAANSLRHFSHDPNDAASLAGKSINSMVEDRYGNMWIGTSDGMSLMQPGKPGFTNYRHNEATGGQLSNNAVNTLALGNDNKLWIGTSNGLDILDIRLGEFSHLKSDLRNVQSLTYNGVVSICIDKQGIYWVGTYKGGINKYDPNLNLFQLVRGNPLDPKGLQARIVNAFAEDGNGRVYIGAEDGGVSLFDPRTSSIEQINLPFQGQSGGNQPSVVCLHFTRNQQQLLIGSYTHGLFVMDPTSRQSRQLLPTNQPDALNDANINCLMEDHLGNYWVGTNGRGINVLNPQYKVSFRLAPHPAFPNDILLPLNGYIREIVEDKSHQVWIASHGDGLAVYNPQTRQFRVYNSRNSNLPSDKVQTILEDTRGNLWVGTLGGGLCLLNRQTGSFRIFSEKEGLTNSNVRKLIEDKSGAIWASTNQGLSRLDATTFKISNYNYNNSIQHNNFAHGAGLCTPDGTLYFGGTEGFNYFNPQQLRKNTNVPDVLLTDLKISNQSVTPSAEGPIQENISIAKEINLDYKQNFSLGFVGLNYTAPKENQYAYKLEGFDKDWNYVGNTTTASYTNLDPGKYTFKVMASNNDGVWNRQGTSITIRVHPPFWRTGFAYFLYALAFVGLLLYIRHRGIRKLEKRFAAEQLKTHQEQERKEQEQARELDQQKIKFLTNLSHEFRTPISLIVGPVETLLASGSDERQSGQLQLIKRNGRRLLNLVNQLLDFRKMEEHELKLQPSEGEFVAFMKESSDAFRDLAEKKKIRFDFTSTIDQLYTRFDHDKLERIVFNLLSNAFKFTLKGGSISLQMEMEEHRSDADMAWVCFTVKDTGIGMPAEQQDKVFERFFQHTTAGAVLNQGTGIGLSITKEFVEMHGGTISVNSELERGTSFTVQIPLLHLPAPEETVAPAPADTALPAEELTQPDEPVQEMEPATATTAGTGHMTVLLIEDDEDFRFYLKDNLQQQYKVYEAANGKEGWQKALALHPQLIVSDVNMPYMDGIELSKKIKADKRTAHIPVILLTALTAEHDQLRGLETGASDYITKPFSFELLNAKIKNLLVLNNTLKTTYTRQIKMLAPEVKMVSEDEKLMERIMAYLEENITNSQLSVEELSRQMGMSRSSLYGKLLELTGETPVEFIRSVKLGKAAVLLEKSDMNITQVAYLTGFSTSNYFTKSFKAKYGMLPSEYMQQKKAEAKEKPATNPPENLS